MKKGRKIYKRLIILAILAYVVYTLINQQQTLNKYNQDIADLNTQINDQKEYNEELAQKQNNVNSLEFIEETARQNLDMYYPNERVYVDNGS